MTRNNHQSEQDSELDRSRAENFELKRQLSEHDKQLNEHKRRIDDLMASTSWRMTAPIRTLADRVKRLGRRGETGPRLRGKDDVGTVEPDQYQRWLRDCATISPSRTTMQASIDAFTSRPRISVIMPNFNVELKWLGDAIRSVQEQIYPHFDLCISDDCSTIEGTRELLTAHAARDSRIKLHFRDTNGHISANSNSALALATGEYVALMDADDLLAPDALFWVAQAISLHPDADLLFSDEDKIDHNGQRFDPHFKSAWNAALMLSQNAFSHLGVFRRSLIEKAGGFREGLEGAQDHDLILRCAEATATERIRHIPRVLYHWRARADSTALSAHTKPYALEAGRRAIQGHLNRSGIVGSVDPAVGGYYQVSYRTPAAPPTVSIIVATDLRSDTTIRCLNSILSVTTYRDFELIILASHRDVETAQSGQAASTLLNSARVRTLHYDADNRATLINAASADARGSLLCVADDSIQPLAEDWLDQLVARVMLRDVGIVSPMICDTSGELLHTGVILGVGGIAGYPFRGLTAGTAGYFGRAALEQDYSCVPSACMLIRRDAFRTIGGFDTALSSPLDAVDFCLRLRRAGLRAVWVPTAKLQQHLPSNQTSTLETSDDALMRSRWREVIDNDPCYNPNFSRDPKQIFELDTPARMKSPSELSAEALSKWNCSRTSVV